MVDDQVAERLDTAGVEAPHFRVDGRQLLVIVVGTDDDFTHQGVEFLDVPGSFALEEGL